MGTSLPKERAIVCLNKKATHNYFIEDRIEAGLVLMGSEVKSLRAGEAHLTDAYAAPKGNELYLVNAHIAEYKYAHSSGHEARRSRKILIRRAELDRIIGKVREKGLTLIPLSIYFTRGKAKVEIGVAKGKQQHDKRADLKSKEAKREIARAVRGRER